MRLLVTGCAGFIGTRFCEMTAHEVVGIDHRRNPVMPFEFYQTDIQNIWHLELPPIDAVVNFAAETGVRDSIRRPEIYYHTNVTGHLTLMDWCLHNNIQKYVLASSSSVYGDVRGPSREDMPMRPLSPYASSKAAAEQLAYVYHHLHGLDISMLRYFTVYGPAGRPDMAIRRFVEWISEGEPVTVFGDGGQVRDFTYVDDIVRGTLAALAPIGCRAINLGGGKPYSLSEIILKLEELIGKKAILKFAAASAADVQATHADITLAGELLNWKPSVDIDAGLARTVTWHHKIANL